MKQHLFTLTVALTAACFLSQCTIPTSGGGGAPSATKDAPFVNSLGMKFVPVPGTDILMCTTETTVAQYQAAGLGYQAPKFPQGSNHPAVNVSWNDAKTWCAWLSKRDGRKYRLPTDAEWSAAVGGSTYPWGNSWPPPNNVGNYAGQELRGSTPAEQALLFKGYSLIGGFSDRHKFTSTGGGYPANGYGLHDLGGNAWEWCEDRHPDLQGEYRVMRGGSWYSVGQINLACSGRFDVGSIGKSIGGYGFRCVVVK
ncbi:MAG: SUMF1/EgtB/PvdO family nonheme iron enzyme [Verrucomicrobiaceae bacterium]|nr:SUMF1/EgtB/PvdO family nonheme iron enzyme [Verrucomicrobiaceae bacterium]